MIQPVSCFLVASRPVRDLLFCAKHLFITANQLKVPMMLGCSQLRTLSGCNHSRSRASRPDTDRSWG